MIDSIHFGLLLRNIDNDPVVVIYQGENGVAELSSSYRVYCDSNYYGQNCEVYCQTVYNDSGLYECDDQGDLQVSTLCSGNYIYAIIVGDNTTIRYSTSTKKVHFMPI